MEISMTLLEKSLYLKGYRLTPRGEWYKPKGVQVPEVVEEPAPKSRKPQDEMNQLEAEWLVEMKRRWPDQFIGFACITLKLAHRCTYTPDFAVIFGGKTVFFEVKGPHMWEDSWVKAKTAAAKFPFWDFYLVRKKEGKFTELLIPKT